MESCCSVEKKGKVLFFINNKFGSHLGKCMHFVFWEGYFRMIFFSSGFPIPGITLHYVHPILECVFLAYGFVILEFILPVSDYLF